MDRMGRRIKALWIFHLSLECFPPVSSWGAY